MTMALVWRVCVALALLAPCALGHFHQGHSFKHHHEEDDLPQIVLDHSEMHQLVFENETSKTNQSFGRAIFLTGSEQDVYYGMLGNPTDTTKNECQLKSYQRVHATITNSMHRTVHGVSFNRDLPQPDDEPDAADTYFGSLELHKEGMEHAKAEKIEFKKPHEEEKIDLSFIGMQGFVWYDCMQFHGSSVCIRVLQVRNTMKLYPKSLSVEDTGPLWAWMKAKILQVPRGNPIIILFQNFSSEVLPLTRRVETLIHHDLGYSINLLGVFFALQSRYVGLQTKICLQDPSGEDFSVPIVNFGALKEGEWLLLQFSPARFGPSGLFVMDVRDQWVTQDYHGHVTVAKKHPWKQWPCLNHEKEPKHKEL